MKGKYSPMAVVFYIIGALLSVWLALLIAPFTMEGLPTLLEGFSEAFWKPFYIIWTEKSLQTIIRGSSF